MSASIDVNKDGLRKKDLEDFFQGLFDNDILYKLASYPNQV